MSQKVRMHQKKVERLLKSHAHVTFIDHPNDVFYGWDGGWRVFFYPYTGVTSTNLELMVQLQRIVSQRDFLDVDDEGYFAALPGEASSQWKVHSGRRISKAPLWFEASFLVEKDGDGFLRCRDDYRNQVKEALHKKVVYSLS